MRSEVRYWDDLTKREATEIFDQYVADHPVRLAQFIADATARGVDPDDLDFGRASLERIWPILVRTAPPEPDTPEDLDREDLPLWAAFRLPYARRIGRRRVELATLIAAYLAECVLRADPANRWVIGDVKGQEGYRKPLLAFGDRARISTESLIATTLTRALDDSDFHHAQSVASSGLRRLFDLRMGIDLDTPLDAPVGSVAVPADRDDGHADRLEVHEQGGGSFHVTVAEEVDDELSSRIDRFVAQFGAVDRIDRVIRDDRDVLLVTAPTMDAFHLGTVLAEMWQSGG